MADADTPETEGGLVGTRLRVHRERDGLTLEEVAERTRVPLRHLEAIEASDYRSLPAAPYAVGFVKSYARLLGQPVDTVGRDFRTELSGVEREPVQEAFMPADPARVPPRWLALTALAVAILFAVAYCVWRSGLFGGDTTAVRTALAADQTIDRPPAAAAPAPPASASVSASAPAATAVSASGPVLITATAPAWIRVSDGDRRLYMDVLKAGDRFQVPADAAHPVLRTAAAQSITITVAGAAVPPVGPASTLVKDVSLLPRDLAGPRAAPLVAGPAARATTEASDRPPPHRDRSRRGGDAGAGSAAEPAPIASQTSGA